MRRRAVLVLAGTLALAQVGAAQAAPTLCVEVMCRGGATPKGGRVLVSSAGTLWLLGKKGAAWTLDEELVASAVKTPLKKDVLAAAALGDGLVVVGAGGLAARWDGKLWTVDKSGAKKDLNAVVALGEQAWAVGRGGSSVHFDGVRWASEPSGVKVDLRGVWGASDAQLWAVGDKGTLLERSGGVWRLVQQSTIKLLGVGGSAANDVYAVGEVGSVMRWDGRNWQNLPTGVADDLQVVLTLSKLVFLLLGAAGGLARHDVKDNWHTQSAGEGNFVSATLHRGVGLALADDNRIWRHAGGWQIMASPTGESGMGEMRVEGDDLIVTDEDGGIARRRGGSWEILLKTGTPKLGTISGMGRKGQTLVAVGYGGNAVHIGPTAASNAKVVARPLSAKRENRVNAMWMTDGIGFAVGGYGEISQWDGKTWKEIPKIVDVDLNDVQGVAADAIWVVGDGGTILFWDGKAFSKQDSGVKDDLEVIYAASKEWAVAAGSWGIATMWAQGQWGKIEVPSTALWRAACGRDAGLVALGGNSGEIVVWNGKRWQLEATPTSGALISCAVMPSGEILLGEQQGGIVFHTPR